MWEWDTCMLHRALIPPPGKSTYEYSLKGFVQRKTQPNIYIERHSLLKRFETGYVKQVNHAWGGLKITSFGWKGFEIKMLNLEIVYSKIMNHL